jgi:tripartite-type tricarboxylate transporter receptor subunit TctC
MKTRITAALCALVAGTGAAMADYPEQPITIVVGASAGGGTDIQARILAERLTDLLGQQVLIDNRPGAGSNIASQFVAGSEPDGYTLTMIAPSYTINQTLYANAGFTGDDFAPVAGWAQAPLLFVVHPDLPVSTLQELADYSKEHPDELDYGNGLGFPNMMVMELFKLESGADIQFVPYPGMAPARTDVIGGQIETTVDSVGSSGPFVESGELKAIAVSTEERAEAFPDVPTVAEAGYPAVTNFTWYGLLAPAGTPQEVLDTLGETIAQIQAEPETVERIGAAGATPFVSGPGEFAGFVDEQISTWANVIDKAGLEKVQ